MKWREKINTPLAHLGLIGITSLLVFFNTLGNGFVWDDYEFVLGWPEVREVSENWKGLLAGDLPTRNTTVYRPLRSFYYAAAYGLWGENPVWYHGLGVGVQMVASGLVYGLVREMTREKKMALVAGIIFGLHPIHVEAVAFVSAVFDTLGSTLFLASGWMWLVWRRKAKKWWYWGAIVMGIMAFFSYELTLTLPLVLILMDWGVGKLKRTNWREKLKEYRPLWLGWLGYWLIRTRVFEGELNLWRVNDSWSDQVKVMLASVRLYITRMVWPEPNLNHQVLGEVSGFYYLDYVERIYSLPGWLSGEMVITVGIIAGLVVAFWKVREKARGVSVGLGFMGITMLPGLQLVPTATLFAEKYAYLASAGAAMVLGFLWVRVAERVNKRMWFLVPVLLGVYIASLGLKTVERNRVWASELSLWQRAVEQTPESATAVTNLGVAHLREGELEAAKEWLVKGVRLQPQNYEALRGLAQIATHEENYENAQGYYLKLLEIEENGETLAALGRVLEEQGEWRAASRAYERALSLDSGNGFARDGLERVNEKAREGSGD